MKSVLGNTRFKTESQITLKSDKLASVLRTITCLFYFLMFTDICNFFEKLIPKY